MAYPDRPDTLESIINILRRKMDDRVTPNLSYVPERTYIRYEGSIVCFDYKSKEELFRITLTTDNAKLLMEDLYYGEYTGG